MRQTIAAALVAAALSACGRATGPRVESLQLPGDGDAGRADPALALDPATGDLLMSWSTGDSTGYAIRFARSSDGGSTWSMPVTVAGPSADIHPHAESAPRLVVSPRGVVAVVWSNSVTVAGRHWPASNIRLARSTDGGGTWTTPLTLNDDTARAPAGHLFHGAAWQGDSTLLVAWMDERQAVEPARPAAAPLVGHQHAAADAEPDARIWLARSNDLGASWGPNEPLWSAACPCCRVGLARGPDGRVLAAWRKHFPGNVRDVVVAPVPGGAAPPEPSRVHADEWVYPGCPHTGPGVALDTAGRAHVAWFSGKQGSAGVYYARQHAAGGADFSAPVALAQARTLTAAHAMVAPAADGGAWVAWDIMSDGRRLPSLARLDGAGTLVHTVTLDTLEGADHPQLVALRDGSVIVAWTLLGSRGDVRLARVREGS